MNEWQCSYCKRVNDFAHKTCDGCGAGKERSHPSALEPVYVTTCGQSGAWYLMDNVFGDKRRYDRIIEERVAAQMAFNNMYFRG